MKRNAYARGWKRLSKERVIIINNHRSGGERVKTHEIKLNEHFCDDVFVGNKNFEVRKNDRGYQKGDRVKFFPVLDIGVHFNHPIETALYEITYVLSGWGIKDEFVVFGIKEVSE